MVMTVAHLLCLPAVAGVYQLHWKGDYQTGEWDTDAAENVAYDASTKHAFIASAEAAEVQVIDVSVPEKMEQVGKLNVGAIMASYCDEVDCTYEDFDFGGGSAPCGYAPMVNIIFDKGDCSACDGSTESTTCAYSDCVYDSDPSYNAGTLSVDPLVATVDGCRIACQNDPACEFFSWENEIWTSGDTTKYGAPWNLVNGAHRAARCFLKGAYSSTDRYDANIESLDCESFVHWEAHKEQTARGTHCVGISESACSFGTYSSNDGCEMDEAHSTDCVEAGGTVESSDWDGGARYPYGFNLGNHYTHVYDKDWEAASGPATCPKFRPESVQSVAATTVPGYAHTVIATASPHKYEFADGMLAFWDAKTFDFLSCGPAGNKPEGIASTNTGLISCINEGSALELDVTPIDVQGSMTLCDLSVNVYLPECTTYDIEKDNFVDGAWKHAVEYRVAGVRLFGPNGNNITYDVEPEGGAFTEDGKYQLVVLQDNDAYAMFDVQQKKYLFMSGLSTTENTVELDGSDKDDKINIATYSAHRLRMPDQVTSFTANGKYYFITSNEGGSRDGGSGLLGEAGDFDGEEFRLGDVPCAGSNSAICDKEQLGRVLTTGFMPSDYALNACGNNLCGATGLASGQDGSSAAATPHVKGAGAFKCIYINADYGGCGSVCNIHDNHYEWADPSGCSTYPTTLAHYVDSIADNAYYGVNCTATNCDKEPWSFAGWAATSGEKPELRESATSGNPLGYDAAVVCQQLCDDYGSECMHWYMEYEMGKYECFLKGAFDNEACHEYGFKDDRYDYSIRYQQEGQDFKPYVSEGYANWGGPRSSTCVSPAPYTVDFPTSGAVNPGPGVTGGVQTIGGRSFTIYKWEPGDDDLTQVFDSGSMMETKQAMVKGGLCDGCTGDGNVNTAGLACDDFCPFNSDEAPPKLDDRSDAKGPEPECVTTGVMPDGTILAFVGMERTGGIMVYDVSNPSSPVYQDYLNVRNWMGSTEDMAAVNAAEDEGEFMRLHALNDGPESLVFISEGFDTPLLLAVTPLAGRLTAYSIVAADTERPDDGSCPYTSVCPYLPTTVGGTGAAISALVQGGTLTPPYSYSFSATVTTTLEDFTDEVKARTEASIAVKLQVLASQVTVKPKAGSLVLDVIVVATNAAEKSSIAELAEVQLASTDTAEALFNMPVESIGDKPPAPMPPPPPPPPPPPVEAEEKLPTWAIAVIVVVAVLFVMVCGLACLMYSKEKAGKPLFIPISGAAGQKAPPA